MGGSRGTVRTEWLTDVNCGQVAREGIGGEPLGRESRNSCRAGCQDILQAPTDTGTEYMVQVPA